MSAVPIYVWNGTAWQETGPTIPANPIKYQASAPSSPSTGDIWVDSDGDVTTGSQQFQRFRFVASGGETTISGADANGAVLAYTAGLEQVILNGAVLVRGHDYTATNGTSITGLSPALVANDVLEVFSFIAFTVANTYTQSQVDGLLADYAGLRLITPTSVANGTIGASGAVTFSGVSSVSLNGVFSSTYDNYRISFANMSNTASSNIQLRFRASGSDNTSSNYRYAGNQTGTDGTSSIPNAITTFIRIGYHTTGQRNFITGLDVVTPFLSTCTGTWNSNFDGSGANSYATITTGMFNGDNSFDGFTIFPASGNFSGTIRVYGYKN